MVVVVDGAGNNGQKRSLVNRECESIPEGLRAPYFEIGSVGKCRTFSRLDVWISWSG